MTTAAQTIERDSRALDQDGSGLMRLFSKRALFSYAPALGVFVCALILFPFFEPPIISFIEKSNGQGSSIAHYIGLLFDVLKVVISLAAVAFLARKVSIRRDLLLLLAFSWCIIATLANNGFAIGFREVLKVLSYVGLLLYVRHCLSTKPKMLVDALFLLFLVFTVLNIATIVGVKAGMRFVAGSEPIYFFGGKNSIFLSGVVFILAAAARSFLKSKTVGIAPMLIAGLYTVLAVAVNSASSTLCFFGITFLLIVLYLCGPDLACFDVRIYAVFIAALFIVTVLLNAQFQDLVGGLFGPLGRSASFSDRDQLWMQAVAFIDESPLIGKGLRVQYALGHELIVYTDHPHSVYLQFTAAYGIPFIALFVADIVAITASVKRKGRTGFLALTSVLFYMLLLHSVYDIIIIFTYLVLREFLFFAQDDAAASDASERMVVLPGLSER